MAAIDPTTDPRGARWEARLHRPVLVAAWLAIPTVFLYFSKLGDVAFAAAVVLSWAIWLVFFAETAIMLTVVADRRAWIRGHLFGLAVLLATLPLLTHLLEALLAARAVSTLQAARVVQVLYLAKAAKLLKGVIVVRRMGAEPAHPLLRSALLLFVCVVAVGIGHRVVTGEKQATPLHGAYEVVEGLPLLP